MSTHVYHPDTTRIIAQLTHTLPHGIMLYGPNGVGLRTVAMQIAGTALTNVIQPTDREGVVTTDGSGEIVYRKSAIYYYKHAANQLRNASLS